MADNGTTGPRRAAWAHDTGTRRAVRAGVATLVVALVVTTGLLWYRFGRSQTDAVAGRPVQLRIGEGSSTREIADALLEAGVIANADGFLLQARIARADSSFRPGVYDLTTRMSNASVIELLGTGPPVDYVTVTIPEGLRVDQIASRFRKAGISRREFLSLAQDGAPYFVEGHPYLAGAYSDSLEGYLFPKTYQVREGMSAKQVIEMMLRQFDRETGGLDFATAQERGYGVHQVVTVASMIERESKLDEERPLVSSVIYNRLARGTKLQVDATIEYVLRDRRLRLTNRDLETKTPYNTYMHEGLPPGPICSPGLKSIKAALEPASTDFVYYVLTGKDGSHTFATNRAAFLEAKKRSKEVFGR